MRSCSLALVLVLAGCPPVDPGPGEPFACTLGLVDEAGFRPMQAGEPLELVLGFQGFLFVEAWIEAEAGAPRVHQGAVELVPDGHEPSSTTLRVELDDDDLSGPLTIFLEASDLEALTDLPASLAVRLQGDGAWCLATAQVLLVDDDACIHTTETDECANPEE